MKYNKTHLSDMDCHNLKMDTRVKRKENVTYMFESMLLSNYF